MIRIVNMRKTTKISATQNKSVLNNLLVPLLCVAIMVLLVYMVWDIAARPVPFTLNSKPTPGGRRIGVTSVPRDWANNPVYTVSSNEGFTSSNKNKLSGLKSKSGKNIKHKEKYEDVASNNRKQNPSPNQSKLSELKNGKYNPNDDLKNYGMDGGKNSKSTTKEEDTDMEEPDEEDTELDKKMDKLGANLGKSALNSLVKKGKRDNFKNVINEVDNINPGAFDLTSIGGTIRRYNENFNNRLNHAKAKNKGDNLEATMAQGSVIFDEFKKIFLFSEMFA